MNDIYTNSKDEKEKTSRIDLFGQYAIVIDKYNFSLYKIGKAKESGNEYMTLIGHYSSLENALTSCKKEYAKREIMNNKIMSLEDAVSAIVRSNNRFESLVKNAFEGVQV